VLEPLSGYLQLGAHLLDGSLRGKVDGRGASASAFNFGPGPGSDRSVQELVEEVLKSWDGTWENKSDPSAPHEAYRLSLDISKAAKVLGWTPRWDFARTVRETVDWYRASSAFHAPSQFQELARRQIGEYSRP
jgi:CDP-glucose 4,6-dehydratase